MKYEVLLTAGTEADLDALYRYVRDFDSPARAAGLPDRLDAPARSLASDPSRGAIQVQPVWCSYDGRHILVNTEATRAKYDNLHARRAVTVLAVDPANAYHWIEVRGEVVEETRTGADAHIDELARTYLGVDKYPFNQPGDVRVLFRIAPRRVVTFGPG
jgi:PPOX class probable F420-dependent enzyme